MAQDGASAAAIRARREAAVSELPSVLPAATGIRQALPGNKAARCRSRNRVLTAFLVALSLLPFWLLPLAHIFSDRETATGFYHEELPYYVANGRAAFERGNGIAYPNPYDPDPAAPAVYAHWLLWLIGLLPVFAEADPGDVLLTVTFFATTGFAAATWKLVSVRVIEGSQPHLPFLLAMWGGGLLVPAGFIARLCGYDDPVSALLQFDPGRGLWFLNWGRNAVFATESVYHGIVAACWICEMRGQRLFGTLWCAALATTHPWSGLQLLLILNTWRLLQWYRQRDGRATAYLCAAMAMLTLFLGYYQIWLPRFDHHRRLQNVWELDWSLPGISALLAYSLVMIPALVRIHAALRPLTRTVSAKCPQEAPNSRKSHDCSLVVPKLVRRKVFTDAEVFLLCALSVSLGLVFHDRLVRPVQPLHFTRGYIWMPLFLLGLPTTQIWLRKAFRSGLRNRILAGSLILLMLADNTGFAVIHSRWLWHEHRGYHITSDDRAIFRELDRRFSGAIVVTESEVLNYLLPAYSEVRPWIGHFFNTPDFSSRQSVIQAVFDSGKVAVELIPEDVNVLAVRRSRDISSLERSQNWVRHESHNAEWSLWGHVDSRVEQ